MNTTATQTQTGKSALIATYHRHEGERQLIGQRVDGVVPITDRGAKLVRAEV